MARQISASWDGECHCLVDGRIGEEHFVDLTWRNLFAAAHDEFLDATGEKKVSVLIKASTVAGVEPAIGKGFLVRFRIIGVTASDVGAANYNFPFSAGGQKSATVSHNGDGDTCRMADRTGFAGPFVRDTIAGHLVRGFRHAVGLHHRNVEGLFQLRHELGS